MPGSNQVEREQVRTQKVIICVATFRRPEQLKLLLASLRDLAMTETRVNIEVMVVDNDANESARSLCETAVLPWPLQYFVEPRRGIAQVRNAAVKHSAGEDWVAFVDDDEIVEPQWLDNLIRAQQKFHADIVAGPVVPEYRTGVPKWFIQSGILVRHRFPTGSRPKSPGTGNVLINAEVFHKIGSFDERFGLTGGEDSEFFMRAAGAGFKIIWCDEAVAHESIGPDRAGLAYLLCREYQDASMLVRAEIAGSPGILKSAWRATKAVLRIVQGMLMLPLACFLGLPAIARALQRISLGAGMLGGLTGITFEPYRNPDSEF
ncbi:MAG TPA: glycosyltransferase [Candidatus Acidoferrales bacterium]|jgi:glycosyltransferase involved in cell wall biosynthesis